MSTPPPPTTTTHQNHHQQINDTTTEPTQNATTRPANHIGDNDARQTSTPAAISIAQRPDMLVQPQPQSQQDPSFSSFQHGGAPAGAALYAPTMPMLMQPFVFPYPWMVATSTQPTMAYSMPMSCCNRHVDWMMQLHRVGRPPHDYQHCGEDGVRFLQETLLF